MRFLADQDVYAVTIRLLTELDHDIVRAGEVNLAQATDGVLLQAAREQGRILVTRDRDFGGLVFVQGGGAGVIYLRIGPTTLDAVHAELRRVLSLYSEAALQQSFVVIEPARHRIRNLRPRT